MDSSYRWPTEGEPVIKETLLSRKPAALSFWVALASVAVLFLMSLVYWFDFMGLSELMPASREAVFVHQEYWRLLTSIGAHADFEHFLSNGIVFGVLALLLYGYYGPVAYPVGAILLGGLVTGVSLKTYEAHTLLLGASGVVYLMAAFWLTLYLLVERRFSMGKRVIRAVGFALIVLVPTAVEPAVSYRTHALGFGMGVAFALGYFAVKRDSLRRAERVEFED
jgi:rhomboid protease GluP